MSLWLHSSMQVDGGGLIVPFQVNHTINCHMAEVQKVKFEIVKGLETGKMTSVPCMKLQAKPKDSPVFDTSLIPRWGTGKFAFENS